MARVTGELLIERPGNNRISWLIPCDRWIIENTEICDIKYNRYGAFLGLDKLKRLSFMERSYGS